MIFNEINNALDSASSSHEGLVLLVGNSNAGKTKTLRGYASMHSLKVQNLTLFLSEQLLSIPTAKRSSSVIKILREWIHDLEGAFIILDNIEILFEVSLELQPLTILRQLSKEKCLLVSWPGNHSEQYLTYAELGHPEHLKLNVADLNIISLNKEVA